MKQYVIIFLVLSIQFSSRSQKPAATTPCTQEMEMNANGKWIKADDRIETGNGISMPIQQEAIKRMDAIHKMILEMYPEPKGVDAIWNRSIRTAWFGGKVKYYRNNNDLFGYDELDGLRLTAYNYGCAFPAYYCSKNILYPGSTNESHTYISIEANNLSWLLGGISTDPDDTMTVDGRPVFNKPPVKWEWKGYELCTSAGGGSELSTARYVLIHRKDMLPYIPVTRKQYLDNCLVHIPKFYDKLIKRFDDVPVRSLEEQEAEKNKILDKYKKDYEKDAKKLKSATDYYLSVYQTDQQRRDQQKDKMIKDRDNLLKRYRDELEKTTADHLLDAPAIIPGYKYYGGDMAIFTTEAAGGNLLVTQNPAYIRKDLPKWVPQFFVISWSWNLGWKPQDDVAKAIKERFPIEKLEALIDK